MNQKAKAILFAFLAAAFYAVNIPLSKLLLSHVAPTSMAALLYLGAGVGVGLLSLLPNNRRRTEEKLTKSDWPYTVGMIVLDIAAPIFLMLGVSRGSPANASLLGNFEIVATTVIALIIFQEKVTGRLWAAIGLITAACALLSFEGTDSFRLSLGSLFVLLATVCWGLENNCTRKISGKSTYQIVTLKGLGSGAGSLVIALVLREQLPSLPYIAAAMTLGFFAYGLSIFLYIRAQNVLGAAKTSAYYAVNPFIGALLSFLFLREQLSLLYFAGLAVMAAGSVLTVRDTLLRRHVHPHRHTFTHTHDGTTHTHTVYHTHGHDHYLKEQRHGHHHSREELEKALSALA